MNTTLRVLGGTPVRIKEPPPWPCYDERDEAAVVRVVRSRRWGGCPYPGPETEKFLDAFLAYQGGQHAVACANGTVTMEIALRAARIGWGDEVIVPAYTFQATAIAPLSVGAIPVLVDIDPQTYCLDPEKVAKAITPRTKAIIAVHLGHEVADLDAIVELGRRHDLVVIEDAAHAHGARWRGEGAGTVGDFGSFSQQSNKLLSTGEGGVLICRTAELARRAASICDNGRPYLPGGRTPGGDGLGLGSNFRMTEFQAALGRVGLERLHSQAEARAAAAERLHELLGDVPWVRRLHRDERHTGRTFYSYVFAIDPEALGFGHRVVCHVLNSEGIPCWTGYRPLHRDPAFRPWESQLAVPQAFPERFHFESQHFPQTERAAGHEAVWLNESLFRDGATGVEEIMAGLAKIQHNRSVLAERQAEFSNDWMSPRTER
jgi:dTDP-4-amino-4,6-dideoxygalactose transaminase